jgi:hypothetical protein
MMAMPTTGPTIAPAIQVLLAARAGELVGNGGFVVIADIVLGVVVAINLS